MMSWSVGARTAVKSVVNDKDAGVEKVRVNSRPTLWRNHEECMIYRWVDVWPTPATLAKQTVPG